MPLPQAFAPFFTDAKHCFACDLENPEALTAERYTTLRRLLTMLMVMAGLVPLLVLCSMTSMHYQAMVERERASLLSSLVEKTRGALLWNEASAPTVQSVQALLAKGTQNTDEAHSAGDVFLISADGVLQTPSHIFGKALQQLPFAVPTPRQKTTIHTVTDTNDEDFLVALALIPQSPFVLMAVTPCVGFFHAWETFSAIGIGIFLILTLCIMWLSYRCMSHFVHRLQVSEKEHVATYANMEHTQKLASIGRLAAGVAHEVNNPLAVINEKAGLAKDILEINTCSEQERLVPLLQSICDAVDRARTITHRLLGLAKKHALKHEKLQLQAVLTETLTFFESEARRNHIRIETDFDPNLPDMISDKGLLQQAFINIIGNALAAVEKDGHVLVAAKAHDLGIQVRVEDTGVGMSEEVLEHIFEPFYTTKEEEGTGLGMFITQGVLRKLGGSIAVQSEEGKGTQITLQLPLMTLNVNAETLM